MLLLRRPNFSPAKRNTRVTQGGRRFLGGGGDGGDGASRVPGLYSQWSNFPQEASFFPVTAWLQSHTVAEDAAACGINIYLALDDGGTSWPPSFGTDDGRLAAIRAAGLYLIAGSNFGITLSDNVSRDSVASFQALHEEFGGIIGYNGGDEPACGAPTNAVPQNVATAGGYDSTRPFLLNLLPGAFHAPIHNGCLNATIAALQATSIGSFDSYVFNSPYNPQEDGGSDFISVPQDSLYSKGVAVANMRYHSREGQPIWAFVAGGNNALGQAGEANNFTGGITNESANLTNASGFSVFTSAWVGLTVAGTGIQSSTTILSITNPTTAVMSKTATATNAAVTVTVTGGDLTCCRESTNLCVIRGNRYRPTPAETAADVWMCIVNGANGIQWFIHDTTSQSYSLGGGGSAGALAAAANLTYINGTLQRFGAILNAQTAAICSMHSMNPLTGDGTITTVDTCSDGILTMATSDEDVPGSALLKSYNNRFYLVAQSSKRGSADMTFTIAGKGGHSARVIYDTNERYDPSNSSIEQTIALNSSGEFTDTFGANGNHYQARIYEIRQSG
jgi:hypothetical protein